MSRAGVQGGGGGGGVGGLVLSTLKLYKICFVFKSSLPMSKFFILFFKFSLQDS